MDEGATCLGLVDVDSGYLKAVRAAAKTVADNLVEGRGCRFVEKLFRRFRLRCEGESVTVAFAGKLKELLPDLVLLERTPRHDTLASLTERAIRTLEEQVKVMRLDFETRTGTELSADTRLWLWLICHAGWVDSRLTMKTNGATPYQDAYDSPYNSELLPFGELVLFRIQLPHTPDVRTKTERPFGVTTNAAGADHWTNTVRTSSSVKLVARLHEQSTSFLQTSAQVSLF